MNDPSIPPPAVHEAEGLLSPVQAWRTVRKNWLLIVALAAAVTLSVTFYTLGQRKIYRATASLQLEPRPLQPLGNSVQAVVDPSGNYWDNKEYYATQYNIIQSRRVAEETVRTLGLQRDGAFLANLPPGETAPPADVPVEAAAGVVRGRLSVNPIKDTRLVEVSFEDADPARAQRIVNALLEIYVEQNVEDIVSSTTTAADWLGGQQQKLKEELEKSEIALHDYKKDKRVLSVSIDDQSNMLRGEMTQLNNELTQVRAKREQIASRQEQLAKVDAKDPTDLPATELLSSQVLQDLRNRFMDAKTERDALVADGKGGNHPSVRAAEARIALASAALTREIRNIQKAINGDLAAVTREASGLSKLYSSAEKRALELNLLEIEYGRLMRAKNNNEKMYSLVQERAKESDLGRAMRFNNIKLVDRALPPGGPVRPRVPFSIAMGALGGLALGLLVAFGRELLDRSLKTPDDVDRELGVPFLGLLPQGGRSEGGYGYGLRRRAPSATGPPELIVHSSPKSTVAEAARAIRTNILFMSPDKPQKRLLVTSAGPSEGKTTVACAVATAMAQAGQRVLLVDCDLRRPRVHKIFRRTNDVGVTTALLDRSVLDFESLRTDIPNLSVLPAGVHAPNPAEIFHSEVFAKFLDELAERYDRLVIDSPPIAPVTDATILSKSVDGTLVVVRAGKTSRDLAQGALRALRDVGGNILGVVLNDVDLSRRGYGGYYTRYHYYRSEAYTYGEPGPSDAQRPD